MAPIEVTRATLPAHAGQYEALAAWIARTAPPLARVVDIGSGDGDDQYSSRVRGLAGSLVGVDPSPTATAHANLDYLVRSSLEQYARDLEPSQRFDVALALVGARIAAVLDGCPVKLGQAGDRADRDDLRGQGHTAGPADERESAGCLDLAASNGFIRRRSLPPGWPG